MKARPGKSRKSTGKTGARAASKYVLLVTCEHAGNRVPLTFRRYFRGQKSVLRSHRGYDAGALEMAKSLARAFGCKLFFSTTSRLLIDLNRSLGHRTLYSPATAVAPPAERREILHRYYRRYRQRVERWIGKIIADGFSVLHLASHSFTPRLHGQYRKADMGLLYDPKRLPEKDFCIRLQRQLVETAHFNVRRNYPYRGRADGFPTYLRKRFSPSSYLGIELEANQALLPTKRWDRLRRAVIASLQTVLEG